MEWFNRLEKLMKGNNFVSLRFSWLSQRAVWKISFHFCEDGRGVPFIRVNRKRLVSFHSNHRRSTTPSNGKQFSGLPGRDRGALERRFHLRGRICENHSHEDQNAGHLFHPDLRSNVMNSVYSEEHQENVNCWYFLGENSFLWLETLEWYIWETMAFK